MILSFQPETYNRYIYSVINVIIRFFFSFLILASPSIAATLTCWDDSETRAEWMTSFPEEEEGGTQGTTKKGAVDDSEVYFIQASLVQGSETINGFDYFFKRPSLKPFPGEVTTPPPRMLSLAKT